MNTVSKTEFGIAVVAEPQRTSTIGGGGFLHLRLNFLKRTVWNDGFTGKWESFAAVIWQTNVDENPPHTHAFTMPAHEGTLHGAWYGERLDFDYFGGTDVDGALATVAEFAALWKKIKAVIMRYNLDFRYQSDAAAPIIAACNKLKLPHLRYDSAAYNYVADTQVPDCIRNL